ncbi:hypothetical protein [Sphingomonas bacterium]|uniref:hypothetical protein n=1 Tax=Sphingomonas bacterium TaxID=1895847 RepID=UPI002601D6D1|nr:hypothetical protein [Sphingomonas bacterium]
MGKALILGGLIVGLATAPASAQFYLKSKAFSGDPVRGDEPGIGPSLPGATPAEVRASLVWNMRAALNVAALSCQFEPTLLTVPNYNAMLVDHRVELKNAFDTLNKYFARTAKTKPAGQTALDQFGTRTYSSFVTVGGQLSFCQTAASIGRDAVFQPRGEFGSLAANRMAELRQTLIGSFGEQALSRMGYVPPRLPRLDPVCWSKKGEWVAKKCGPLVWPPAAAA